MHAKSVSDIDEQRFEALNLYAGSALEDQVDHRARAPARQDRFHVRMPVASFVPCR